MTKWIEIEVTRAEMDVLSSAMMAKTLECECGRGGGAERYDSCRSCRLDSDLWSALCIIDGTLIRPAQPLANTKSLKVMPIGASMYGGPFKVSMTSTALKHLQGAMDGMRRYGAGLVDWTYGICPHAVGSGSDDEHNDVCRCAVCVDINMRGCLPMPPQYNSAIDKVLAVNV